MEIHIHLQIILPDGSLLNKYRLRGDTLENATFGWGELISLVAVVISFSTICISALSRSKNESKSEQRLIDKLDSLSDIAKETSSEVKSINKKIDDHAERLAHLESNMDSVFRRIKRVEDTQDHCQACRASKQQLFSVE